MHICDEAKKKQEKKKQEKIKQEKRKRKLEGKITNDMPKLLYPFYMKYKVF